MYRLEAFLRLEGVGRLGGVATYPRMVSVIFVW